MKEIIVEVKQTNIRYEAVDGKVFNDKSQCEEYEKSAKCAIRAALKDITIVRTDGDVFPGACSDQSVYVVKPETDDDIMVARQFEALIGLKWDPNYDCRIGKQHKGKLVIITVGYEEDWIDVRTLDGIISDLTGVPQGDTK